jgi:hypothetical protein
MYVNVTSQKMVEDESFIHLVGNFDRQLVWVGGDRSRIGPAEAKMIGAKTYVVDASLHHGNMKMLNNSLQIHIYSRTDTLLNHSSLPINWSQKENFDKMHRVYITIYHNFSKLLKNNVIEFAPPLQEWDREREAERLGI